MSLSKPSIGFSSKHAAIVSMSLSMSALSFNANAGFLDSIYDVQNTISSIGRTADTIRGSKNAVGQLGEEVGIIGQNNTEVQNSVNKPMVGSTLLGKLQSTKLYSQASNNSNPIAVLSQQDIMIYMGTEQNGYYYVNSDKGEGWVLKPLVGAQ